MTTTQKEELRQQADAILKEGGFTPDGRPEEEKKKSGGSIYAIPTPCGGQPRRWRN